MATSNQVKSQCGPRRRAAPDIAALQRRHVLFFVGNKLNEPSPQLFASDLDVIALTGFEQRTLTSNQFANSLLKKGGQTERTADLLDQLLGEALFHGDVADSVVRDQP